MTLQEAYNNHCVTGPDIGHGDKGGTHSYIDEYAKLLDRFKDGCTLMEMGLAYGLSIAMWREYMPNSTIIGVDRSIVFDRKHYEDDDIVIIEADVTKPDFLNIETPLEIASSMRELS